MASRAIRPTSTCIARAMHLADTVCAHHIPLGIWLIEAVCPHSYTHMLRTTRYIVWPLAIHLFVVYVWMMMSFGAKQRYSVEVGKELIFMDDRFGSSNCTPSSDFNGTPHDELLKYTTVYIMKCSTTPLWRTSMPSSIIL